MPRKSLDGTDGADTRYQGEAREHFPWLPAVCWRSSRVKGRSSLSGYAGTAGVKPLRVDYQFLISKKYLGNKLIKLIIFTF